MSESAAYQPRMRATRVRMLGDAVPVVRGAFRDDDEPKIVPKTSDELRADREAARDAQPMTTSCAVDGCAWSFVGSAGECRDAAAAHRKTSHPERVGARTHRLGSRIKRRGETIDPAIVAESRRLRQERDDEARLQTINRGRAARGELLEEAAVCASGDVGAASSNSAATTTTGRASMTDKRAPKPRGYWTFERIVDGFKKHAELTGAAPPTSLLNGSTGQVPEYLPAYSNMRKVGTYDEILAAAGLARPAKSSTRGTRSRRLAAATPPEEDKLPPATELELREAPPGHGSPLIRLLQHLTPEQLVEAAVELEQLKHRLEAELALVDEAIDTQRRAA